MRNLVITTLTALAASASAACTREQLKAMTDDLLAAQTSGQTNFSSLSSTVTYTENRKPVALQSSILSKPLVINHSRAQHDVGGCGVCDDEFAEGGALGDVVLGAGVVDN